MAKWLAALIILFPVSMHQVDFRARFTNGLAVNLPHTSPAYAALEDSREEFTDPALPIITGSIRLVAGKQRIIASMSSDHSVRLALNPLIIRRSFQSRPPLQQGIALHTELPNLGPLPMDERKKILAQYFSREDWSVPGVGDRAKQLVAEEIANNPPNVDARLTIGSVSKSPIIVAKPGVDISGLLKGVPHPAVIASANPPPGTPSSAPPLPATAPSVANAFRNNGTPLAAGAAENHAFGNPSLTVQPLMASNNSQVLKGQLQIKDGLAFMGEETYFTLHRVNDGRVFESGKVMISEARFEIYVSEPRGHLIAELHARGGQTLGRGVLDLEDAQPADSLRIELIPVSAGAAVRVTSGYSDGTHPLMVRNALVAFDNRAAPQIPNSDGVSADADRSRRSTFVVRAQAPAHWPTLSVGAEGSVQEVRLYPESLLKSLMDLTLQGEGRKSGDANGIVWGRIVNHGKPVSGVEVELAGDYTPVYFNKAYLPDATRSSTDGNGSFAFLNVRAGVQALRIKYGDKVYPAQIFPAEGHHLSYVEMHLEANHSVNVALQDAFDLGKGVSAHVRFVGVDDEVMVQEEKRVVYPAGPSIMTLEADAGSDYELSRVQVLKDDTHVAVPLIRHDWLQSMVEIKQITLLPHRGTVVGFVTDQPFQVELTDAAAGIPEVVYFDSRGRLAEGGTGPAGGGFILFNAPLGLQTLLVKPLASTQVFSQTFVAEPEFIHAFKYSFGESY